MPRWETVKTGQAVFQPLDEILEIMTDFNQTHIIQLDHQPAMPGQFRQTRFKLVGGRFEGPRDKILRFKIRLEAGAGTIQCSGDAYRRNGDAEIREPPVPVHENGFLV